DRCDLALAAGDVAELVDAFDGDERRVHVHREELQIGEAPAFGDEGEVDAFLLAIGRDGVGRRRFADAPRVLGDSFHRARTGEARELCGLRANHDGALRDEVHKYYVLSTEFRRRAAGGCLLRPARARATRGAWPRRAGDPDRRG